MVEKADRSNLVGQHVKNMGFVLRKAGSRLASTLIVSELVSSCTRALVFAFGVLAVMRTSSVFEALVDVFASATITRSNVSFVASAIRTMRSAATYLRTATVVLFTSVHALRTFVRTVEAVLNLVANLFESDAFTTATRKAVVEARTASRCR